MIMINLTRIDKSIDQVTEFAARLVKAETKNQFTPIYEWICWQLESQIWA